MAQTQELKFTSFQVDSFAGISEGMSSLVFLDQEARIVGMRGNQAVGKTSHLNALKALLGEKKADNAINSKDGRVKASLTLIDEDGSEIKSQISATRMTVTVTQNKDGKMQRYSPDSPQTWIREKVGPIGSDPMWLKRMDGAAQVKWLRDMAHLTPELEKFEADLISKQEADYKARTGVGKDMRQDKAILDESPYFVYDKEHKVFVQTASYSDLQSKIQSGAADADLIRREFDEAQAQNRSRSTYEAAIVEIRRNVDELNSEESKKLEDIARIQSEIEEIKTKREALNLRIENGEKTIEELKDAPEKLNAASLKFQELNNLMRSKDAADDHNARANAYASNQDRYNTLTAKLAEWETAKLRFVQAITPNVPGIEVKVKRTIDLASEESNYRAGNPEATDAQVAAHLKSLDSGMEEGLFYQGRSVSQLCESELWDLCLILWRHMGVKVVFIEDLNALGSDAVDRINWFAQHGRVFYSEMDRAQKKLKMVFQNAIPNDDEAEDA